MSDPFGNTLWEGPIGMVNIEFDGDDMGKTTEDTNIEFIEDIKDIFYNQDGTQPADKVPTGQAWKITGNFAEITLARMEKLIRGITLAASGKSAKFTPDLYRSGLANFAKELILRRVNSDGTSSTNAFHRATYFKAFPMITGPIGAFGADTQRVMAFEFYIFRDSGNGNAFGYSGYFSSLTF